MESFGEKEFREFVQNNILQSGPFKKFCQLKGFDNVLPELMCTNICNFYLKTKEKGKNGFIENNEMTKSTNFFLEQYVRVGYYF